MEEKNSRARGPVNASFVEIQSWHLI